MSSQENRFKAIEINVNQDTYNISSSEELQELFIRLDRIEYKEFYFRGNDDTSLIVLMNAQNSLCVYFADTQGGNSYHIHNPDGNPEKYDDFILSNGQRDEYEQTLLVDNKTAQETMLFYFTTGKQYEKVVWVPD